jgi:hypothetical protein
LEVEIDSHLVEQPRELHAQIAGLFRLARSSVDHELADPEGPAPAVAKQVTAERCATRPATPAQIRAIHALARRQHLDLATELQNRFGVDGPEQLAVEDASNLIDWLKESVNGAVREHPAGW